MNPNRAAPTIPPAHNTMNARNTSAILLINGSPLSVISSPSIIGMMSRFSRLSRPEWDKRKNWSCGATAVKNGRARRVCPEGWRQPISVRLQADKSLCSMELIGIVAQSQDLGFTLPAPTTTHRISDHQVGPSSQPYAPEENLCLEGSVFDSLVNAAVKDAHQS
jgi:hypothetical protein